MWQKIEQWCSDEARTKGLGRVIKSSLLPGGSVTECLMEGTSCWHAFQAIYAFYAGQCDTTSEIYVPFSGLFGGYQAYDMASDTRWFKPRRSGSKVTIAYTPVEAIELDLKTGQLYFNTYRKQLVATPCVGGINRFVEMGVTFETPANKDDAKDSILRWFEEHANRLQRDYCSVGTLNSDETPSNNNLALLKYPSVADTVHCSRAVTRGIEIVASAVFVEVDDSPLFIYSIRMRLLTPEDGEEYMSPEQRGFRMCQLRSRHWKISKKAPNRDEPSVQEVRGDGVVGYYPLLVEGGYVRYYSSDEGLVCLGEFPGCFRYQSCTEADESGTMEGFLQFSPGNMISPTGPAFNVRVAPFPLEYPQFLY